MSDPPLNEDFRDLLALFAAFDVEHLIVGAHAMAVHGVVRATGDIDILVRPTHDNARRVVRALEAFGAPVDAHGVTPDDFVVHDRVYQMGLPPRRIDLLTSIAGIDFDAAWSSRTALDVDGLTLSFIGLEALRTNERACGRAKDIADLALLDAIGEGA